MLPEQAIEISKVRFDHAKECLRDAKLLLAGESYRSAANRAYYAIFHAMRAVLALDGGRSLSADKILSLYVA